MRPARNRLLRLRLEVGQIGDRALKQFGGQPDRFVQGGMGVNRLGHIRRRRAQLQRWANLPQQLAGIRAHRGAAQQAAGGFVPN